MSKDTHRFNRKKTSWKKQSYFYWEKDFPKVLESRDVLRVIDLLIFKIKKMNFIIIIALFLLWITGMVLILGKYEVKKIKAMGEFFKALFMKWPL